MTRGITIEDPLDPRVADFVSLTDAQLRRDGFIVEGEVAIRQLLRSSYPVRAVLLSPPLFARLKHAVAHHVVYVASLDVMREIAGFNIHRGAVASADRVPSPAVADLLRTSRRLAILEGLNDHENLGGVFRNAAAFGIDAVLLDPTCADPLYRRAVRVSLGHVLHVPFARMEGWPACLRTVTDAGFDLLALTPSADAMALGEQHGGDAKLALMFGDEGHGLSDGALAAASRRVRIPMDRGVDSVNVAAAAAIVFHHTYHRR
ncbi:MAG: TrmH family RNA methyltransferase [Acidimicrobiales bacterium]